jgi:hypothetical protein
VICGHLRLAQGEALGQRFLAGIVQLWHALLSTHLIARAFMALGLERDACAGLPEHQVPTLQVKADRFVDVPGILACTDVFGSDHFAHNRLQH